MSFFSSTKKVAAGLGIAVGLLLLGCGEDGEWGGFATSFINPTTGKEYKTVRIGAQTWMAENLNYETSRGSWCYSNNKANCNTYGRLYDWAAAMNISSSYNSSFWRGSDEKHQGVCPIGWHLPSATEWEELVTEVGSQPRIKLSSTFGWYPNCTYDSISCNGTDDFGFSALPGGLRYEDGGFHNAIFEGHYQTVTETDSTEAYHVNISPMYSTVGCSNYCGKKTSAYSVRCVKN